MKVNGREIKLTREEREIEAALERGEYRPVSRERYEEIMQIVDEFHKTYRKDAVLNLRVNAYDLERLKKKAEKVGMKYQTFISSILHREAHA